MPAVNIPCVITKDLPEQRIKVGTQGIAYAKDGAWWHVEVHDKNGKPRDYAIICEDDLKLEEE